MTSNATSLLIPVTGLPIVPAEGPENLGELLAA